MINANSLYDKEESYIKRQLVFLSSFGYFWLILLGLFAVPLLGTYVVIFIKGAIDYKNIIIYDKNYYLNNIQFNLKNRFIELYNRMFKLSNNTFSLVVDNLTNQ